MMIPSIEAFSAFENEKSFETETELNFLCFFKRNNLKKKNFENVSTDGNEQILFFLANYPKNQPAFSLEIPPSNFL